MTPRERRRRDRNREEHDPDEKHDRRAGGRVDRVTARDMIGRDPNPERRGRAPSAIVAILGGWLLVEAVLLAAGPLEAWNAGLVGATLLAIGAYNYRRRSNAAFGSAGAAGLVALLGLWLLATPLLYEPAPGYLAATDAVVGVVAFLVGGYDAAATLTRRRDADPRPTAVYDRRGQ